MTGPETTSTFRKLGRLAACLLFSALTLSFSIPLGASAVDRSARAELDIFSPVSLGDCCYTGEPQRGCPGEQPLSPIVAGGCCAPAIPAPIQTTMAESVIAKSEIVETGDHSLFYAGCVDIAAIALADIQTTTAMGHSVRQSRPLPTPLYILHSAFLA